MRENMPWKIRNGNQGEDLRRKIYLGSAGKGGFLFKRKMETVDRNLPSPYCEDCPITHVHVWSWRWP